MILQRLRIKDYGRIKDADVDLSGLKLSSIVGTWSANPRRSNGAGKSTLLESIRYALFGIANTSHSEGVIREGSSACEVELTILLKGNTIKVMRGRSTSGTSIAKIWINDKLAGEQTKIVNAQVEKYLGIDGELFDLVYFFRQDNQSTFVTSTPGERKAFFARIFNMSKYEKCAQIARNLRTETLASIDSANGAIKAIEQERSLLPIAELSAKLEQEEDNLDAESHRLCMTRYYVATLAFDDRELSNQLVDFDRDLADKTREFQNLEKLIQVSLNELNQKRSELARFRPMMNMHRTAVTDLDKQIEAIKYDVNKDYDDAIIVAERVKKDITEESAQLSAQVKMLNGIIDKTTSLTIGGNQCPTCLQKVTEQYVNSILSTYNKSLDDIYKKVQILNVQINKVLAEIASHHAGKASKQNKEYLIQRKEDQRKLWNEATRNVEKLAREETKYTDDLYRDQRLLMILSAEVNAIDATAMRQNIVNAQASLAKIIKMANQRIDDSHKKMVESEKNVAVLDSGIKRYNRLTKKIIDEVARINELKRIANMYDILTNIFGKNGIQALMIENIVHIVESFANDILKEMQTTFTLQLNTQRKTQAGDDKETLDILVFDQGNARVFELYSGAERMLINIALRCSLAKVICNFYGIQIAGLFLDEVLGSLDEVNMEIAIKVLSYLSTEFSQIFVITHESGIRDMISNRITVTRYPNHSSVEVNNGRDLAKAS